jgi:hypothetical protein
VSSVSHGLERRLAQARAVVAREERAHLGVVRALRGDRGQRLIDRAPAEMRFVGAAKAHEVRRDEALRTAFADDGRDRPVHRMADHIGVVLGHERGHQLRAVAVGDDGRRRLLQRQRARLLPIPLAVPRHGVGRHEGEMSTLHLGALRAQRLVRRPAARVGRVRVLGEDRHDHAERVRGAGGILFRACGDGRERRLDRRTGAVAAELRHDRRHQVELVPLRRDGLQRILETGRLVSMLHIGTMNGFGLSRTNFCSPRAMRRMVFSASGRFTPTVRASAGVRKIDGHGSEKSMHSAPSATAAGRDDPSARAWAPAIRSAGRRSARRGRGACASWARRSRGHELAPVHGVAEVREHRHEPAEGEALTQRARLAVGAQRAPRHELLDVLERDHGRPDFLRPAVGDPGEASDLLLDRPAALRLREVLAVGREPHEPDLPVAHGFARAHLPDVLAVVLGPGMVARVHRDRLGVVVDRDVGRAAGGHLDAERGTTAAGEAVDDQAVDEDAGFGRAGHLTLQTCTPSGVSRVTISMPKSFA